MKKIIVLFLLTLFFIFPKKAFADENFLSTIDSTYQVDVTGATRVSNTIYLENKKTNIYAVSYSLILTGIKPEDVTATQDNGSKLDLTTQENNGSIKVNVKFPDAIVGIGNKRTFTLNYVNKNLAVKTGEIWEISIPRLESQNSFESFIVRLKIPKSLGNLAYISPNEDEVINSQDSTSYIFKNNSNSQNGISAAFGNFQVFGFELTYHLENPIPISSQIQIALPPDTAYQKMYYTDIAPDPSNVSIDQDGNWQALYYLKPGDRFDVKTKGSVQIFPNPRKNYQSPTTDLGEYLKPTEFWQTQDPQIQKLSKTLKTPKAIYDYVTQNLKYDITRVKPNIERFGAIKALENPKNAICMEYTDLFIALARAAGIPAREINGYAYTENPDIEPISLVSDVLHAWPEYYDSKLQSWVPVDPTWGSTSGIDFFSKLDLRHFVFVVHGLNPNLPYPAGSYKLGTNPQKDVFVSFGKLPILSNQNPDLSISFSKVTLKNTTINAIYSPKINIFFDQNLALTRTIPVLPPFGYSEVNFEIPSGFLGFGLPQTVDARLGSLSAVYSIPKNLVIVKNISLILLCILVLILVILRKKIVKIVKLTHAKITQRFT
ncbi:transglutaminase domain-containing protein [Candidatus Woesebacteria bacterium]|nr:transglutaminase domain-containing protein [Candidatus Woesebacteria bacterium]QQG47179.1 MAG: transglutaminase domain-containing protein [Candidatus Woesebacteria bacterium]